MKWSYWKQKHLSLDYTIATSWPFGSIFVAKLRPTNNYHQIVSECTKSHMEFQKFSGGDTVIIVLHYT